MRSGVVPRATSSMNTVAARGVASMTSVPCDAGATAGSFADALPLFAEPPNLTTA